MRRVARTCEAASEDGGSSPRGLRKDFGCPLVFVRGSRARTPFRGREVLPLSNALCSRRPHPTPEWAARSMKKSWAAVFDEKPSWVLCDSWNGLLGYSELCATREYGRKYIEATAANANASRARSIMTPNSSATTSRASSPPSSSRQPSSRSETPGTCPGKSPTAMLSVTDGIAAGGSMARARFAGRWSAMCGRARA